MCQGNQEPKRTAIPNPHPGALVPFPEPHRGMFLKVTADPRAGENGHSLAGARPQGGAGLRQAPAAIAAPASEKPAETRWKQLKRETVRAPGEGSALTFGSDLTSARPPARPPVLGSATPQQPPGGGRRAVGAEAEVPPGGGWRGRRGWRGWRGGGFTCDGQGPAVELHGVVERRGHRVQDAARLRVQESHPGRERARRRREEEAETPQEGWPRQRRPGDSLPPRVPPSNGGGGAAAASSPPPRGAAAAGTRRRGAGRRTRDRRGSREEEEGRRSKRRRCRRARRALHKSAAARRRRRSSLLGRRHVAARGGGAGTPLLPRARARGPGAGMLRGGRGGGGRAGAPDPCSGRRVRGAPDSGLPASSPP